jgi:hypothetical protein
MDRILKGGTMKTFQAVKKPIEITAVEFDGTAPDGVEIREWSPQRYSVFNRLHISWIEFAVGDMLNIGDLGDVYPIDRATFEATYDIV